jgi:hypothetical protein
MLACRTPETHGLAWRKIQIVLNGSKAIHTRARRIFAGVSAAGLELGRTRKNDGLLHG